ncbi:aminotransferase [Lentinula edodes]|uniref:aminotransferase n=1 Tax=Lentinula edodes TaxID=5353 RepID=UPI001E8EDE38|nr:aminotransferase [Lentinula edodes]KAH7875640.1 aminotransferase [Lentinula edodes]
MLEIRLRQAIKKVYDPQLHRDLDVEKEILVTSGANEGQHPALTAFLEQGDEVIMFEPFFDQYLASVTFNGGVPIYVPLHSPANASGKFSSDEWKIDPKELRAAITPRTKMIIVNTPHNPVGKVFTRAELEMIASLAKEHNLLVMADEVYDTLVFDGKEHVRIATLPGMWDCTVTVGSAGKSFAATGWRVGWLIGPEYIIRPTLAASTRIVFCSNSPLQEAAAAGLEQVQECKFFQTQTAEYAERRKVLTDCFDTLGLSYTNPEGSYFILLDISRVEFPDDYAFPQSVLGRGRDFKACWFIALEVGVSSIPVSEESFPHSRESEGWSS